MPLPRILAHAHTCAHACTPPRLHPAGTWLASLGTGTSTHACLSHVATRRRGAPVGGTLVAAVTCGRADPGQLPEGCWACQAHTALSRWVLPLHQTSPPPGPCAGHHHGQRPEGQPPDRAEEAHPLCEMAQWAWGLWGGRRRGGPLEVSLRALLLLALPVPAMGLWSRPCTRVRPSLPSPPAMQLIRWLRHHVTLSGHARLPLESGPWLVLSCPRVADPGHGHSWVLASWAPWKVQWLD